MAKQNKIFLMAIVVWFDAVECCGYPGEGWSRLFVNVGERGNAVFGRARRMVETRSKKTYTFTSVSSDCHQIKQPEVCLHPSGRLIRPVTQAR
jgi:hypothetical protein